MDGRPRREQRHGRAPATSVHVARIKVDDVVEEALAAVRLYQPDVLILPLGFDIYKNDPQAKVSVSSEGFCRLSTHIRQLGLPTLIVQEGGYDLDALSENVQQFFRGLEG